MALIGALIGALTRPTLWAALAALAVASAGALAESPATGAGSDAQRAYAAGQYVTAWQLWAPQAEAGDIQAQLGLALMYDLGQGVPRDPVTAYKWYRRAAEAGSPEADFNVAVMNDMGDGTRQDTAAAALWYARAAAHGNHRAQYNLGQLYAAGDGVPRNAEVAEAYFRAASAQLPAALNKLTGLQRNGQAVQQAGIQQAGAGTNETLRPAQPNAPLNGSTVAAMPGAADAWVELVWTAPAQASPVRFFVQVLALDESDPREVFAATVDETAVLAPVQHVPGRYAWRVYSVGQSLKHYAASDWVRFAIEAPK